LKKILGKDLFEIAIKKKSLRSGKGKGRGRKYKSNSGVLFVISKEDRPKTKAFDIVNVNNLSVKDVAKGGLGRLTVYTEKAIKEIGERFK
jgi:large subunit ribosomal protein L4e